MNLQKRAGVNTLWVSFSTLYHRPKFLVSFLHGKNKWQPRVESFVTIVLFWPRKLFIFWVSLIFDKSPVMFKSFFLGYLYTFTRKKNKKKINKNTHKSSHKGSFKKCIYGFQIQLSMLYELSYTESIAVSFSQ